MKTVLIIGADFIPSTLPPALRIRFFATHLPEFGWKPIVLTTDSRFYETPVDADTRSLVPEDLEVIRTPAFSPRWTRKCGLGDVGIRSLWHHWSALNQICRERKVDLIFIPVPPSVSMVLGRLAWQRYRIPYVVDYIDPWVSRYYFGVPRRQRPPKWRLAHYMAVGLEPYALRHVAHITGVSKGTTESVVTRYNWLTPDDSTEIPYGGEPADFDYLRQHPRANGVFNPNDGYRHLSYVGAVIPAMHPALRALLTAVRQGLASAPDVFRRLRIHFVGTTYARQSALSEQVVPMARDMGLESLVTESPARVPYLTALQILIDSDATVILGSDQPHYTASKLFPYILAGTPMLAMFHERSNAVDILRDLAVGNVITFGSADATESTPAVQHWLERVIAGSLDASTGSNWKAFESYTTRTMTARLASAFDQAVGKSGKRSSGAEDPADAYLHHATPPASS